MAFVYRHIARLVLWVTVLLGAATAHAYAATCGPATSPGTAPPSWQTYCWIDMTSYSNAQVMGAGQAFTITLSDGSVFSFQLNGVAAPATSGLAAIAPPSWTGAAVGNTAFLGIPNRPILYTTAPGTITLTMSNIMITPPPGGATTGLFKVVVADAESTNNGESLTYTTNGGNWEVIDQVNPISGSNYPTISNTGTTFTETGIAGTVGSYIVGTQSPTTVTVRLVAGGLQGVMFAIQYATISTNKVISGGRANAADQFTYGARVTSTGTVYAQGTSSGAGNGPFAASVATVSSSVPTTVFEQMAAGSVSQLAQYSTSLTCTNGAMGSPTVLPVNQPVTSFDIASIAYGDAISCTFTNTPRPATVALQKITLGAAGGVFSFTRTNLAAAPANVTTTAAGVAAPASPTPIQVTTLNTQVQITEAPHPNFTLTTASCTDANAAVTGNPASFGSFAGNVLTIPAANVRAAAQITCTITNTATAPRITFQKALGLTGRISATDQFRLTATGTGAPASITTTGSGTNVTSAAMAFTATAGASYTLSEAMAPGSASAFTSYIKTAACTNSNAAGTNVSTLTSYPITFTIAQGDGISCILTNTPGTARLSITKSANTAGPVSLGQIIIYTYTVSNTGTVPLQNITVSDMHGTPAVQVPVGAGGVAGEILFVAGPSGAGASPDSVSNNGVWSTLAPGASVRFFYNHTVTQAEIDNG
jgi:uncharacterized repeat protein (TIGR01451 family)